jgi:3-mercaptopyruvate sulfurtransferase SseA
MKLSPNIRCINVLRVSRHELRSLVRAIDGGMTAWQGEGYPLSTSPVAPQPASDFGADIPARAGYMIDTAEAQDA